MRQAARNTVRELIWPWIAGLKDRIRRLEERMGTGGLGAPQAGGPAEGGGGPPPAAPIARQRIQYRIRLVGAAGYIDDDSTTGSLLDVAHILYRARGGERLSQFTLSRRANDTGETTAIRLEVIDPTFSGPSRATADCVIEPPALLASIEPNLTLAPNELLVLWFTSGAEEIDTTTEITWSVS